MALWEDGRNFRGGWLKKVGHMSMSQEDFFSSAFLSHSPPPVYHEMSYLASLHAPWCFASPSMNPKRYREKKPWSETAKNCKENPAGSRYKKSICYWILISELVPERSQPMNQSLPKTMPVSLTDGCYPLVSLTAASLAGDPATLCFSVEAWLGKHELTEPRDTDFNFIWFSWGTKARGVDTLKILRGNRFLD